MKLTDLPPAYQAQAEKLLKKKAAEELPANLEAAREMCDAAESVKLEKELQKLCGNELHRRGIRYLHLSPKARESEGWPDLTFPHPLTGRFVAVELKRTRKSKVSEAQQETLADLAKAGALCRVVRSFAEFLEVLNCKGEK